MQSAEHGKTMIKSEWGRTYNFAICILQSAICLLAFAGCGESQAKILGVKTQKPEEALENALAVLKDEKPALSTYRSGIHQLNNYLDQDPAASGSLTLTDAEKKLLQTPNLFDYREERLHEVERKSFSLLDIHHLDSCFLFRDAGHWVQGLLLDTDSKSEAGQLQLAEQAFAWVMRQVQLQPRVRDRDDWRAQEFLFLLDQKQLPTAQRSELARRGFMDGREPWRDTPWPAHEVLRRGSGDAEERLRVFLALLDQLGLDGCVIPRTVTVTEGDGTQADRDHPWAAGVRIGKEVYLFDPLLSRPVPGPGGKGIATLRQLQQDPDAILKPFYADAARDADSQERLAACTFDPRDPLTVTAAQLAKKSIFLAVNLPAPAPRMRALQTWLREKSNNPVILHDDVPARLNRFQAAGLDADVKLWTGYPTVLLARFVENPLTEIRKQAALAPRLGMMPLWAKKLIQDLGPLEKSARLTEMFDVAIGRTFTEPGSARDLLVRGRPDQAIDKVLSLSTHFDKVLELLPTQGDLDKLVLEPQVLVGRSTIPAWRDTLLAHDAELNRLINERVRLKREESAAARQLEEQIRVQTQIIDGLWVNKKIQLNFLDHKWVLPLVREHLAYFMGLAKMELAIRAEQQATRQPNLKLAPDQLTALQQWQSAAEWFENYLTLVMPQPRNLWSQAATTQLATCRAAITRLQAKPAASNQ